MTGDLEPAPMPVSENQPEGEDPSRWNFLRDVAVFEVKMLLDNARDLALMPASLIAALIDLIAGSEREGGRFYKVLSWGGVSAGVKKAVDNAIVKFANALVAPSQAPKRIERLRLPARTAI